MAWVGRCLVKTVLYSDDGGDGGGGKTVGGRTKEALHALLWLEYGREDEGSRLEEGKEFANIINSLWECRLAVFH